MEAAKSKIKHNPQAELLITDYINEKSAFAIPICHKIREIILTSFPKIIEDWKWGPNYYSNGMVCGFGAYKKHVSLFFFRGKELNDPDKLLNQNENVHNNRHLKFTDVKEVKANQLKFFIKQAITLNATVPVVRNRKDKTITLPVDLEKALSKAKQRTAFEAMAFYKRKEIVNWIEHAKREETRLRRIEKAIEHIKINRGIYER